MASKVDLSLSYEIAPQPVRMLDGGRMLRRGVLGISGAALVLAAPGLWLAPGADWTQEFLLVKLCLSLLALLSGLACLQAAARPTAPQVEIDTIRHEVRLVRRRGSDRTVLERCRFADLERVRDSGTHVELWARNGALIAEVAATDCLAHRSLVTALRVAGRL